MTGSFCYFRIFAFYKMKFINEDENI